MRGCTRMAAQIEPSDADKARRVWKAAAVPGCGPLDDAAAETLAHDLGWAATWRANASSVSRERERLEQIEDAAVKLASLLVKHPGTRDNIEMRWPRFPGFAPPPNLHAARRGLRAIRKATQEARRLCGVGAFLREKFGSPERQFISELARVYLK
jgi:hypothetical protein